jgi:ABC-type glycerol-3-phosphate transport system substrate-binding protein
MRLKTKHIFALVALSAASAILMTGCSNSSSTDTGDKELAAGHALPPALQAEMQADVAKQEAQQTALQAQLSSHPKSHTPAPPPSQ